MSTLWSLYHNIFTRAILPIYLFPSSEQSSPTYRPDAKQRLAMRHEIDTFVTVPGVSLPAKIPPALRPTSRVMSSPKGATALPKLQKSRHNVLSMSHDRFSDVLANATTLSPIAESVASDSTIYFPASDLLQEDTDSASKFHLLANKPYSVILRPYRLYCLDQSGVVHQASSSSQLSCTKLSFSGNVQLGCFSRITANPTSRLTAPVSWASS